VTTAHTLAAKVTAEAACAAASCERGATVWLTGLPSAGKTTLARALAERLRAEGHKVGVLDGDEIREFLSTGLGFTREDRHTNVTRIGFVAQKLASHGVIVLAPVIAPYAASRAAVRERHAAGGTEFVEIHVATPVEVCCERDVKGLYARQAAGEICGVTGVDDPYEAPENPELRIQTQSRSVAECAAELHTFLAERGLACCPRTGVLRERPDGTRNPLQTVPLLEAIESHRFDAVFGGGRRDEEKARAKERVFSLRDEFGAWDPRRQRPELWQLYNGRHAPGEHVRVFPLSNWTELDVWQYIEREDIELPAIYYAHKRQVFSRGGMWLTAGEWGGPSKHETPQWRLIRYRTVGDMSCTGAVDSDAATNADIIAEIAASRLTERGATRADDKLSEAAMEDRKREGYF